jgi:hypothetical protein
MADRAASLQQIDERALQTNQAAIVALVAIAFVIGFGPGAWLIAFVGLALAVGAALPGRGPFQLLHRHVLKRYRLVTPRPYVGDPAPHRFAQTLGAACLLGAAALLLAGATVLGAALSLVVVALALTNLVFGFCAGCWLFLQIARFRGQPRVAS